jgi:hypothetical protein
MEDPRLVPGRTLLGAGPRRQIVCQNCRNTLRTQRRITRISSISHPTLVRTILLIELIKGGKLSKGLQLTKRSYTPSFDDDDAAEMDPFAEIDDSFDVEDFETKLFRDKKATQCAHIDKLVDLLVPSAPSAALQTTCDELLALFDDASEQLGLESHFVSSHGLLAVLEMLEVTRRDTTAAGLLKIVNTVCPDLYELRLIADRDA